MSEKLESKILIIGASGFGREVLCCILDMLPVNTPHLKEQIFFMDTEEFYSKTKEVSGFKVIDPQTFNENDYKVSVAIGNPKIRENVVQDLPKNTVFQTVIHPTAVKSQWVKIGNGSIITAGCILTTDIVIGEHSHLNLHTTVGHDCNLGAYLTTAPGVNISGACTFGKWVYFGSNSSVRQGINITDDVTIGMGGVVVKNISESGIYVGNPVKKLIK